MTHPDRIWSGFHLDKDCHHVTDDNQVRLYLAQLTLALQAQQEVLGGAAGAGNLEVAAMTRFMDRLGATLRLLGMRHFYAGRANPLKIDTTDSGFMHFSTLLDLAVDLRERAARLEAGDDVAALRHELALRIIRGGTALRDLQERIAERLFLEHLDREALVEPLMVGELVAMAGDGEESSGFWSFATYDRVLNRPFVYMIYFGYEDWAPIAEGSHDHRDLLLESTRLASGGASLLSFCHELDDALPRIHPRMVRRVILGPYWAPGFTENEGALGALLDGHRDRAPFALRWETETLLSDREQRVGGGLLSRGRLKQIFWLPRDIDLRQRGVSRLERSILVPHWLGQRLAEDRLLPDHRHYVIDEECEVHGVH